MLKLLIRFLWTERRSKSAVRVFTLKTSGWWTDAPQQAACEQALFSSIPCSQDHTKLVTIPCQFHIQLAWRAWIMVEMLFPVVLSQAKAKLWTLKPIGLLLISLKRKAAGSFSANTQSLPNIYLPQEEWANFPQYLLDLPLPRLLLFSLRSYSVSPLGSLACYCHFCPKGFFV